ncbi:MAG: CotH kinase family protein, partial [Oscillospiraceae bacterium]|nr:CotH kinase family protein [Oscillospiraceae bacterium]
MLLLSGCSGTDTQISSSELPETEAVVTTETEPDTTEYSIGGTIPVLSIETINQEADVLDFVEKTVSSPIAKSIASWTPGYKMPPAPYYEACTITLTDADNTVLLNAADAKVKVRGNWTTTYDKKPLRIKFTETQNLLGLNDGEQMKNWVLLAEYKDTSMLRNKTALSIARELLGEDGLYAADAAFVEVEINHQYWGVYLLTELQQINPDRVNITEPEKNYAGTDIGYFMEFDGYFTNEDALHQFHVDYADNAPLVPFDGNGGSERTITPLSEGPQDLKKDVGMTIKSDIYTQEQHDFIASYVNNVYRILYAAAYEDTAYQFDSSYTEISAADITAREAIEQVIDVNSLVDMYIISELTCDADIYWSSFFMDVDFEPDGDRRLRFEAPWDFDSALGNKNRCADGTGFYAANIIPDVNDEYETVNPWLAVLMYEDWFQDLIREKWTNAYDSG